MRLRTENVEELEAVERVVAEEVICRRFKVVDELGIVRVEILANDRRGNVRDSAAIRVHGRDGKLLALLSVDGRGGGSDAEFGYLHVSNSDDQEEEWVIAS